MPMHSTETEEENKTRYSLRMKNWANLWGPAKIRAEGVAPFILSRYNRHWSKGMFIDMRFSQTTNRRQDLLRGGAKLESRHSRRARAECSSCSMTNSFVNDVILVDRVASCWHLHQLIAQGSWLSDSRQSELKMQLLEVEGHMPQYPIAGGTTVAPSPN